jgi:citrate lyase subunit gamma (acyl carrier protein)
MKIQNCAVAGTMESSDAYVEIEPGTGAVEIQLESVVEQQFGDTIRASVQDVLEEYGVTDARVHVVDRGALDCVIRARVETAVLRGKGEN